MTLDIMVLSIREAVLNHNARCRYCGGEVEKGEKCIIATYLDMPISGYIPVLSVYHLACYNIIERALMGLG